MRWLERHSYEDWMNDTAADDRRHPNCPECGTAAPDAKRTQREVDELYQHRLEAHCVHVVARIPVDDDRTRLVFNDRIECIVHTAKGKA